MIDIDEHDARALGLRAVACPGWQWLDGMLVGGSRPALRVGCGAITDPTWQRWPDLRDPCTLGGLLAVVRAQQPGAWVRWWRDIAPRMEGSYGWCEVLDGPGRRLVAGPSVRHPSEAHALVAALEAVSR